MEILNDKVIIGIDHGYGYIKTANTIMKSGIEELPDIPPFNEDILIFNNRVYAVGQNRTEQSEDKTTTEDYYLLTLAAIAQELKRKQKQSVSNIYLAVGLPYSFFNRQKTAFQRYLGKNKNIEFKYEGKTYRVGIKKVYVFPQGYPMIEPYIDEDDITVVDIGSKTIDILNFQNGKPMYSNCTSINDRGTLDCIEMIRKAYTTKFGGKLKEELIQKLFLNKEVKLPPENIKFIKTQIKMYARGILKELQNKDITYNIIFCGGGSTVIKNYVTDEISETSRINDDIYANAKGYEKLALYGN